MCVYIYIYIYISGVKISALTHAINFFSWKWKWRDIRPSMVTHTRNLCSAFDPSKVHTHSSEHTNTVNTHPEQWAAIYAAAPGEQFNALKIFYAINAGAGLGLATALTTAVSVTISLDKKCIYSVAERTATEHSSAILRSKRRLKVP